MPFGLMNASAAYQKTMNKIFQEQIGQTLEVYMDVIIIKFGQDELYTLHLQQLFRKVGQYNMRLNPKKCTFEVRVDKFFDFYLIERWIDTNFDKCEAKVQMSTPTL